MLMTDFDYMERFIVTGLIVSKEYIDRIHRFWDHTLFESPELQRVSQWCIEYYDKYNKAPDDTIEAIYLSKLKSEGLHKSEAEYIEELLTSLSDEYGRDEKFNAAYLYDQTIKYFKSRKLEIHNEEVQMLIDAGKVEEAEKLAQSFTLGKLEEDLGLELSSKEALDRIERAFSDTSQKVISYPGALGDMWNEHLIRGGFFTFLAPEKRGKSWMLLEMALRSIRQRYNVAFFEAGDMTESQFLKRVGIYLARRSDQMKYCQERFRPVGDCVLNQLDLCNRNDRNCDHGIMDLSIEEYYNRENKLSNFQSLQEKYKEFPEYETCTSHICNIRQGTVWLKKVKRTSPLTGKQARGKVKQFFQKYKRRFRLISYPAGTLTINEMKKCLNTWERIDGFVPDIIIIDYADLLSADDGKVAEFRHRQDHVWKSLRGLSQERHALVISATQADAKSYTQGRLSLSNFSEDKRKLSHVTAQYGLNHDAKGREKRLGILRINEIVVREGEFSADNEVAILQDISIGRPFLESYKIPLSQTNPDLYNKDEEEEE